MIVGSLYYCFANHCWIRLRSQQCVSLSATEAALPRAASVALLLGAPRTQCLEQSAFLLLVAIKMSRGLPSTDRKNVGSRRDLFKFAHQVGRRCSISLLPRRDLVVVRRIRVIVSSLRFSDRLESIFTQRNYSIAS